VLFREDCKNDGTSGERVEAADNINTLWRHTYQVASWVIMVKNANTQADLLSVLRKTTNLRNEFMVITFYLAV
jgi:hypothetical protein